MRTLLALLLAAGTLLADDPPLPIDPARFTNWEEAIDILGQKMHWTPPDLLTLGPEDAYYMAPTQAEIDDIMKFFLARRELAPWLEEVFDCDDKATEFKYLATLWSVRQWHGRMPGALVGKAYVRLDGPYSLFQGSPDLHGLHVINFVVRNDGEVFFIEPQNGQIAEASSFIYEGTIEIIKLEY